MQQLDQYLKEIERELSQSKTKKVKTEEVGIVTQVRDGVVVMEGLDNVTFGEIIQFDSGAKGMVIDLTETVGAIVLGDYLEIKSGETARATGETLSIPVSDDYLGRVVDPLGDPLDGNAKIKSTKKYPIEKVATGVIYRKSVSQPVQTGIIAIDALVPIGRGQRELIIGDRGTGKTTLAIDTFLNQKNENMICIYCAVGQKNSKVAQIAELLKTHDAMAYSVIVSASASASATLQFLAPYAATSIAEYFQDKGKDVLVIYDDLSKHAWAYRQVSLILRRPAGREAYPGDVFYLHSRLLERANRRDDKFGGGSITALPIIETLAGDVSAYIPTNVISITDGNIILDSDLFNSGVRPAISVGLSVSRVGGSAQTKAMKQVAGRLKLDLAQYRDLAAFSQFESELDAETKKFLTRGAKTTRVLIQKAHVTYDLATQVALIWSATNGYLDELNNDQITKFVEKLVEALDLKKKWKDEVNKTKILSKELEEELKNIVTDIVQVVQGV